MGKRKISSQDFLNLLDDQELAKEKAAFKPAQPKRTRVTASAGASRSTAEEPRYTPPRESATAKGFKLSPMQKEWLKFAAAKTPGFIKDLVISDRALTLLERVYASLDDAIAALHRLRAERSGKTFH